MKKIICNLILLLSTINFFGQNSLSVLFLGNSYTSANNLPLQVKNLSTAAGKTLVVDSNMPGGFTISNHLNNPTSLNKIKQGNWDYIVIQEQSQVPTIDEYRINDMYPAIIRLKDTINLYNPCAKIITYMTWGRRFGGQQCDPSGTFCSPNFANFNEMQNALTSAYLTISNQLQVQCAPAGVSWQNVLNESNQVLHSSDNSHPNIDGTYLTACTIFSCIWKLPTNGLQYTAGIANQTAQYYQLKSDNCVFNSSNNWNLYINSPNVYFSEVISDLSVSFFYLTTSLTNGLSYFWDFGDGSTSNLQNPSHSYAIAGNYTVKLTVSKCGYSTEFQKNINLNLLETNNFNSTNCIHFSINENKSIQINSVCEENLLVSIYNVTGQLLKNVRIDNQKETIDLSIVPSGVYFIKLLSSSHQEIKKILVK